jgi:PelA/Pel-15E family pectate lyase
MPSRSRARSAGRSVTLALCALLIACSPGDLLGQQPVAPVTSWGAVLNQSPGWYASDDAVRIADNVLLYQLDVGGWDKNINMAAVLDRAARAEVLAQRSTMRANIDNDATPMQTRFLARVHHATGIERFREGFTRGFHYLLDAQYENGGWPQYHPLREGYYSRITFNDNAMVNVLTLFRDIVEGVPQYSFVTAADRARAAAALDSALDVILRTQIRVDGVLTAWCAQYDEHDLTPAQARSYELPSISGSESVGIVRYLMSIRDPSPEVVEAIQRAVAWFDGVAVHGIRVQEVRDSTQASGRDRVVVADPNAPALWARFYEIGTNRPMFSGRDGVKKYTVAEIENERRVGYSWWGTWPATLLEQDYPAWQQRWAPGRNVLAAR